ncbi:hypothetical protein R3P38DRAFT_3346054 [Favolaschia claudopus]|uniref:Uncharacterized protein n=1 Tax=Favolaschia claudopus TaxID=2862362 RepID=A0AAW0D799_9AGAR
MISFLQATISGLVSIFILFPASCVSAPVPVQSVQTAVTLWQINGGRLLGAQVTLPLEPLGTLADGSATTYLYQALNAHFITTTNSFGFTTQTIPIPTPRTVIASASGWYESLESGRGISCGLVNSTFGQCFDLSNGTTKAATASGKPIAEVIAIASPTPTSTSIESVSSSSGPTTSVGLELAPPTASPSSSPSHSSTRKGVIAGGIIAAFLVVFLGIAACLLLRRRRLQQQRYQDEFAARGYNHTPTSSGQPRARSSEPVTAFETFSAGPRSEKAQIAAQYHRRDESSGGSSSSSSQSSSSPSAAHSPQPSHSSAHIPTEELVRILAERMQSADDIRSATAAAGHDVAPPAYPTTPRFRGN